MNSVENIRSFYSKFRKSILNARTVLGRPLTLTEKILFAHAGPVISRIVNYERGRSYMDLAPDRVDMQDVTAQMVMLQLMSSRVARANVSGAIHCDHLIVASEDNNSAIQEAEKSHGEVYEFLKSSAQRYGLGFWKPGAGIIHQTVLEHYAFPGGLMIGTDSHTPNCAGLGMLGVGVGGADAVDALAGLPWELKYPKVLGIKLSGRPRGWTSPKDLILYLAGLLTCKGGTGYILEYFGPGAESLSCSGKATIANMGAEVGATSTIFPYDSTMSEYLRKTGREALASVAEEYLGDLNPDDGCTYDQVIEIDLDRIEPYVNGPFSPDRATRLSELAAKVRKHGWPETVASTFIGSCTNSSYEDITRVATLARMAMSQGLHLATELVITPGSEQLRKALERDGQMSVLRDFGAKILTSSCGPCVAQWTQKGPNPAGPRSIVTSFNRNFAGRNDGNPETHAFLASPETVLGFAIAGRLTADYRNLLKIAEDDFGPLEVSLPKKGLISSPQGCLVSPDLSSEEMTFKIDPESQRLQELPRFSPPDLARDFEELIVLIKVKGKCTTDQISPAGPWFRFRGHLDNISDNFLIGAKNAFNDQINRVHDVRTGKPSTVPALARSYQSSGKGWVVVADENYGEGSSREHAALELRHLGGRAAIVRSFARIHETNLKKQGVLPLVFRDPADYEKIREHDIIRIDVRNLRPEKDLVVTCNHRDGSVDQILVSHTLSEKQIAWFRAGSALNLLAGPIS